MATIIENPIGRRMVKLSIDDVLMIISLYQQKFNTKCFTYAEVRQTLANEKIYLPEDF